MGVLIAGATGCGMSTTPTCLSEYVVRIMRLPGQAGQLLAHDEDLTSVCPTLGISKSSYRCRCVRHAGMKVDGAKYLKCLEAENEPLKQLLEDAEVEKAASQEVTRGRW